MFILFLVRFGLLPEWPPFEKELFTRLTICSLCILTVILVIVHFSKGAGFGFCLLQFRSLHVCLLLL